jgi:hypothetical protein
MAAGLASGVADDILDALLNSVAWTEPAEVWVKLHTGDPGAAGTSNAATETDRQQASFGTPSGGAATTDAVLTWTNVAATETYTHISLWDASTSGNFLGSDALNASKDVDAGDTFEIAAGDLDVTLTPIAA